jgi:hypothetical protein
MKRALAELLPVRVRVRIQPLEDPALRLTLEFAVRVSLAIVIGAATHVLWDSLTHEGRLGVVLLPALDGVVTIGGRSFRVYKLLQYGCTLIGLPAGALILGLWLRRRPVRPLAMPPAWTAPARALIAGGHLAASAAAGLAGAWWAAGWPWETSAWYAFLGRAARTTVSGLAVGALLYSVLFVVARRRHARAGCGGKSGEGARGSPLYFLFSVVGYSHPWSWDGVRGSVRGLGRRPFLRPRRRGGSASTR